MSLPTADDLFRPTPDQSAPARESAADPRPGPDSGDDSGDAARAQRRSSGRVRHDEKVTVYVTADELLDLEHARLELRREHGLGLDRGRLVREAVAIVLADLERSGGHSALVRRLTAGDRG